MPFHTEAAIESLLPKGYAVCVARLSGKDPRESSAAV
jgi:hypothetical protein